MVHAAAWETDGWGGGAYAEYWSTKLVLRSMVSAGGYDGDHRRTVNGNTASGNRSGNSWTGVVSLAPPSTPATGSSNPRP